MDVKTADAKIVCTADIGDKVVTNHNRLNLLKLVLFEKCIEKVHAGFAYALIRADEYAVKVVIKTHHLELRYSKTTLGIREKINLLALLFEGIKKIKNTIIKLDELCGCTTEKACCQINFLVAGDVALDLVKLSENNSQIKVNICTLGKFFLTLAFSLAQSS